MNFVRCLFGTDGRRIKVQKDIQAVLKAKYPFDFTCITYGKDNHRMLLDNGIKSVLVCDKPLMFPDNQLWAHKIFAWLTASESFDKFIYLDWDVFQMRPLPENFESMFNGKKFMASLRIYFRQKIMWRREHRRKTPCASWLYFGDSNVAKEIYQLWIDMNKPRKEEAILSRFTEHPSGTLDLGYYLKNYEPHKLFCLKNHSPFISGEIDRDCLFMHLTGKKID